MLLKKHITLLLLFISGCLAGIINGFIGSGGGVILIFAMTLLVAIPSGGETKVRFATAVASILPMCAVSVFFYLRDGRLEISDALPYLLPAAIGGVCGSLLMDRLSPKILKIIFAVLMIWAGGKIVRS